MNRYPNICPYLLKDGSPCNNLCWRDYCYKHFGKIPFKNCLTCNKPTQSKYQLCNVCGIKVRSDTKYQKNKLLKTN